MIKKNSLGTTKWEKVYESFEKKKKINEASFWLSALISRSHCFCVCREDDEIYCGYSSETVVVTRSNPLFSLVHRNSNPKLIHCERWFQACGRKMCDWNPFQKATKKKKSHKHNMKIQHFKVSTPIFIINAHNLTIALAFFNRSFYSKMWHN